MVFDKYFSEWKTIVRIEMVDTGVYVRASMLAHFEVLPTIAPAELHYGVAAGGRTSASRILSNSERSVGRLNSVTAPAG